MYILFVVLESFSSSFNFSVYNHLFSYVRFGKYIIFYVFYIIKLKFMISVFIFF